MNILHFVSNYASFGILAVSGFGANWLVDYYFSPHVLGLFNSFMAWYIFASQVSTLGQQITVQNFLPRALSDRAKVSATIGSSAAVTLLASIVTSLVLLALSVVLPEQSNMIAWLAATILAVGLNKVFIFSLAALGHYHRFALGQAIRPLALLFTIAILGFYHAPDQFIFLPFLAGELAVFIFGYFAIGNSIKFNQVDAIKIKASFIYGIKGAIGLGVSELNTRIDIIMLSILSTQEKIAIFSISLIFFEGYYQLLIVIRNMVSRTVTHLSHEKQTYELKAFLFKTIKKVYLVFLPVGIATILISPFIVRLFPNADTYNEAIRYASIVVGAQILVAGPLVFENIYSVLNRPGIYSMIKVFVLVINIFMQWILYKEYSLLGTSIATASSFVFLALFNFYGLKRALHS